MREGIRETRFSFVKPIINLDDPVGKTVGTRSAPNVWEVFADSAKAKNDWRRAGMSPRIPKGVYRFHSHEEADEWLVKMMTRPAN